MGIDISQAHVDAAVVDHHGNLIQAACRFENTGPGIEELWRTTRGLGEKMSLPVAYAMEASGIYHLGLLSFLLEQKAKVWSFNPLLLQGERQSQIRKTKTDALDAELIAHFARKEGVRHPTAHWDADQMRLREHGRVRFRLVHKACDARRQLRRDLDTLCPGLGAEMDDVATPAHLALLKEFCQIGRLFEAPVEEIEALLRPFYKNRPALHGKAMAFHRRFAERRTPSALTEPLVWEVKFLVHELELLEEQLRQVETRIEREMERRQSVVMTVPGVGFITAAVIEGELGDARRFSNEGAVVAFAGLDPTVHQSGKFQGTQAHISKRGSPRLREALYKAALSASRCNPACRDLYERLLAKGKPTRVALIGVARKLLVQCWAVMREGRGFQLPERYRSPVGPCTAAPRQETGENPAAG